VAPDGFPMNFYTFPRSPRALEKIESQRIPARTLW
jgi:hypothetical protein